MSQFGQKNLLRKQPAAKNSCPSIPRKEINCPYPIKYGFPNKEVSQYVESPLSAGDHLMGRMFSLGYCVFLHFSFFPCGKWSQLPCLYHEVARGQNFTKNFYLLGNIKIPIYNSNTIQGGLSLFIQMRDLANISRSLHQSFTPLFKTW